MYNNLIYYQWYPYRFKGGYYIENPTYEALETFYENIMASDPKHESFVLIFYIENNDLNLKTIDEYVKETILPYFFKRG